MMKSLGWVCSYNTRHKLGISVFRSLRKGFHSVRQGPTFIPCNPFHHRSMAPGPPYVQQENGLVAACRQRVLLGTVAASRQVEDIGLAFGDEVSGPGVRL